MMLKGDLGHALTSAGVGQFGPAEEAQVSGPSPDGLRVSEAEPGAEVVRLQRLVSVHGEVTAGVVAAVHPDLQTHNVRNTVSIKNVFICMYMMDESIINTLLLLRSQLR